MAGDGNETGPVFTKSGNRSLVAPEAAPLLRILFLGKLKSLRQGRIVGADRRAVASCGPPQSSWRSIEPEIRRSANGSQAGTTEHSRFLPQHGTKGAAQYHHLSRQWSETDRPHPIVRQILGCS